jgi:TPR repeat protein
MSRILPIALLSLLCINSANADLYSASNALSRGDYETAVAEFTKLAEKGDDKAQANLGYMYYAGEGVPQDYKQAVYWYRKAGVQGNRDAQYNLAVSYAFGEGVAQDLTEAAIWYRRAGEQGHVVSQYSLGISYAYGEGVPQDQTEAARWFTKAANQGYARAQVQLGSMHHTGEGVTQDYSEAVRWYRMAADRGDATAQYNLGTMYRSGKGVEQNYAQAKRWFRQSADQGYAAAQNELASLERSAGANVATRTIQAKPEIFPTEPVETIAIEELPETTTPEPVAEIEPAQEEKLVFNETAVPTPETKQISEASSTAEPAKKPLFSVDKKDLLTLDSSQLDIPEPIVEPETAAAPVPDIKEEVVVAEVETPVEAEIAEVVPTEDVSVDVDEAVTDKPEVSVMHNAMGLPQPKPAQEKEEDEPSENLFTAIGNLFSGDDDTRDEEIEESIEAVDSTTSIAEDEPAAEIIASDSDTEEYVSAEDPTLLTEQPIDIEEAVETEPAVKEYVAADDPTLLTNEPVDIEELTETETAVEEYVAAEDSTLLTEQPVDTEEAAETETAVEEYVAAEDSTLLTEPTVVEQDEKEEIEASGGFFSTIGKFFSGEEKQAESEIVEEDTQIEEEIVIAKLDEPAPVSEEIELAQDVEDELSQYSVDAGRRALSYNDYKEAEKQFRPLAEAGDSEAQSHLGSLYYVGNGVEQNFISAFLWYKKAADQGNVDAQYSIGNMYLLGEGIEQNNEEAGKWYTLASEQGHVAATGNLKNLQKLDALASKEVPETPVEIEVVAEATETEVLAEETESIATESNITESIDDQVEQSTGSAIQDEVSDAEPIVDEYVAEADPTLLTTEPSNTEEVKEDNESSGGFFSTIGNFFSGDKKQAETEITEEETQEEEETVIVIVDEPAPVIEESELAQDAEHDLSQYSVDAGRRALVNGDFDAAVKQFRPLAEAGDSEAQSHLGSLYYVGKGVEQSIDDSFNWYKKAADQGNVDAQYSLGNMYLLGEAVEQNNEEAASWYTLASEQGHVAATNNLNNLQKLDALNRENKLEQQAVAEQEFQDDISTESTTVKSYAAGDAPSTESLQTYPDTEPSEVIAQIDTNSDAEISVDVPTIADEEPTQTSVADTALEAEPSEQSEFFEGLFGKSEPESTALKEDDNINLDDADSVEETVTETTVAQTENESNETIATVTEETKITEESEESGGLFGFIGKMFSSDEEKEIVDEAVSEVEAGQELAMLEPELDQGILEEDETNFVEQITEEVIDDIEPKTELEQLRSLATQGDQDAQYKLGSLYYSGDGAKQDFSQSALWYRRAAQQGNVDAQYSLGNMYLMGEGIDQDDQQAVHWYALAADQGHMSASHNLANLQKSMQSTERLEIETNIVADEPIANTETKEEDASSELAIDETGKSDYEEGLAYAFGDGVPQNDRNAFNLYFSAAVKGYALAQYKVGVAYAYGEGVRQDNRQAAEWFQKAAEQGYTIAQRNLAMMYLDGNGIQQDKVHALAWYKVVASQGNAMDIRRRDMLEKELSENELTQSQELSNQISSRLSSNTSL